MDTTKGMECVPHNDRPRDARYLRWLRDEVERRYGVKPDGIAPATRGYYGETWKVCAGRRAYFLKTDALAFHQARFRRSLPVIAYLYDHGADFVGRVIPTREGRLLARKGDAEEGLFDTLAREGVGCIAFSPLRGGVLTDKYLAGIPSDSRAGHDPRYLKPEMLTEDLLDKVRALNEIAAGRGQTLAEMALSWVLRQPQVTSLLIGASKPEQIVRNCAVTDAPGFSDDELRRIDELTL